MTVAGSPVGLFDGGQERDENYKYSFSGRHDFDSRLVYLRKGSAFSVTSSFATHAEFAIWREHH